MYDDKSSRKMKNGRITIIATLKLVDNKLADLKEVVEELQAYCAKTEEGMIQYDWYVSDNSNTLKVIESYKNSEAVLFHFDNFKRFADRLNEVRTFVSLEIFGNASEALKLRVAKINAPHYDVISFFNP